jgi:hypothetical protein
MRVESWVEIVLSQLLLACCCSTPVSWTSCEVNCAVSVGLSGSWFSSSVDSRLRKVLVLVVLSEELVDDVVDVEDEVVDATLLAALETDETDIVALPRCRGTVFAPQG